MENIDPKRTIRRIPYVGGEPVPGTLVEMVYRPQEERTLFAIYKGGVVEYLPEFSHKDNEAIVPYSAANNLIKHRIVLFASHAEEYGTDADLVKEIQSFIHRYVDVTPAFERIMSHYVLLTWIYDAFAETSYGRVRGDWGSGKTRFLQTVGSICFRPIFASGASTASPLFRILDTFRGTLVLDESDFKFSNERQDIVKILNQGTTRGFPVLRSESSGPDRREYNPVAFYVFGPKLVGSRNLFQDRALESRFLTEETGYRKLRSDIPLNVPPQFNDEALHLRNKLLVYRFRNLKQIEIDATLEKSLEPRLRQVLAPLFTVIKDEGVRGELKAMAVQHQKDLVADRSAGTEGHVLEIIHELLKETPTAKLSVGEITERFISRFAAEYGRPITAKWIGAIIRNKLNFKTYKSNGVFLIVYEKERFADLFDRYGFDSITQPICDMGT